MSTVLPVIGSDALAMSDAEYQQIRSFLHQKVGIALGPGKKALVCGRLCRRLEALSLPSYGAYFNLLASSRAGGELQTAIDLLTTNETYFYREPAHFVQLQRIAREAAGHQRSLSVWSAAASSGEEIYTIAMVLAQTSEQGRALNWQILGTDISRRVLERAARGVYPMERVQRLPPELLRRYCLKGEGPAAGTVLVDKALRSKVRFAPVNLIEPLPDLGHFDVIFLRNVLIYFDLPTRRRVVKSVLSLLKPEGVLFVGMAESLNGVLDDVRAISPGAYVFAPR